MFSRHDRLVRGRRHGDEHMVDKVHGIAGLRSRSQMSLRCDNNQRQALEKPGHGQIRREHERQDDTEIVDVGCQVNWPLAERDIQRDLRMPAFERCNQWCEPCQCDSRMSDKPKYAGWHPAMVRGVGFQTVEIVEDAAASVIKALRNLRQRKLTLERWNRRELRRSSKEATARETAAGDKPRIYPARLKLLTSTIVRNRRKLSMYSIGAPCLNR